MKDYNVTAHWKLSEFRCRGGMWCCGGTAAINKERLVPTLEIIRRRFDSVLYCVQDKMANAGSGFRCLRWNEKIDGHVNSDHTRGDAADIFDPKGDYPRLGEIIAQVASEFNDVYFLVYPLKHFYHVGIRKV